MTTIWSRIRLELARSHEFPAGSLRHGYVLVLPLADEHIDEAMLRKAPELCTVHRFWEGEGDAIGHVVRAGPRRWAFSYGVGREDDEPVPHLAEHAFRVGEYLAVRDAAGVEHVCRIVAIEPAPGIAHTHPR